MYLAAQLQDISPRLKKTIIFQVLGETTIEMLECLKHWIRSGLVDGARGDAPGSRPIWPGPSFYDEAEDSVCLFEVGERRLPPV